MRRGLTLAASGLSTQRGTYQFSPCPLGVAPSLSAVTLHQKTRCLLRWRSTTSASRPVLRSRSNGRTGVLRARPVRTRSKGRHAALQFPTLQKTRVPGCPLQSNRNASGTNRKRNLHGGVSKILLKMYPHPPHITASSNLSSHL